MGGSFMSNHCDHLIDYFNGQLSDEEKRSFEEHLTTCGDCREELRELQELTDDLGFISEPIEPPSALKQQVLEAAFNERTPNDVKEDDDNVHSFTTDQESQNSVVVPKSRKKLGWVVPSLAAALLLSLVGNGYAFSQLSTQEEVAPEEITPVESISVDSLVQQLSLQPSEENIPFEARASFVNKDQHQQLIVEANQLTQTEDTQVYQVWLLKEGDPYRAGTFTPAEDGSGMSTFEIDPEMGFDTIAITIEPDETSEIPEGEIVLLEEL